MSPGAGTDRSCRSIRHTCPLRPARPAYSKLGYLLSLYSATCSHYILHSSRIVLRGPVLFIRSIFRFRLVANASNPGSVFGLPLQQGDGVRVSEEKVLNVGPLGIEVAYERFGDRQAPPVLLVMGVGAQMINWPRGLLRRARRSRRAGDPVRQSRHRLVVALPRRADARPAGGAGRRYVLGVVHPVRHGGRRCRPARRAGAGQRSHRRRLDGRRYCPDDRDRASRSGPVADVDNVHAIGMTAHCQVMHLGRQAASRDRVAPRQRRITSIDSPECPWQTSCC